MRFLSIQSHVAYGYVGNRAATFPLQRLGHEVWAVNTVQFSNHAGYGGWRGRVAEAAEIRDVIAGIEERGVLASCDGVLSGFLGDAALGEVVIDTARRVRAANPRALWCCDPVIGDEEGGIYVRPGIAEFFRDRALASADITTPNRFELELLTGHAGRHLDDALAGCRALLAKGPSLVLLTSFVRAETPDDSIEMLAVDREHAWLVSTPRIDFPIAPSGTGDMVAALFTARLLDCGDAGEALGLTASSIFSVLSATATAGMRELQLVAAQDEIVAPAYRFTATRVA